MEANLKRQCRYCDLAETSHVCKECQDTKNKKETMVIRYLRKHIDTPFEYNSNRMLQGCSLRRPDVFFELSKHCVIVEIDENQHRSYNDQCECARLNEIVNGIGGKSVIVIRFNPDQVKHGKNKLNIPIQERLEILVNVIKQELVKDLDHFQIQLIQMYYDDDLYDYKPIKEEELTSLLAI